MAARSNWLVVALIIQLCVWGAAAPANGAISVASSVAQFVSEPSTVARMYAALDPGAQVYLVVWSTFALETKGQFLNTAGRAVTGPFQIAAASGYARVIRGANEFLVTYQREPGQRWGRSVKYVNGSWQLGSEFFITSVFVDSDAGMAYVPSAQHYLVTSWQNAGGYHSYVTGVRADGTITIPTTLVTGTATDTASPEIACDFSRTRCLMVGYGDAKRTWGRYIDPSTGAMLSSLMTLDSGSLQEDHNIEWNPTTDRFLIAYVRNRSAIVAKRVYADGSVDATATLVISGNYGQLGLSYNPSTNSFLTAFKDAAGNNQENCWIQELNGEGDVVSGQLVKVSALPTSGNAAPITVANAARNEYLFVQTRNYTAGDAGVLAATTPPSSGGGTVDPPPPPPPPPPPSCTYQVATTSVTLSAYGSSGSINVDTNTTPCAWTAASNASWLTVTGGGSSSGTASYTALPNPSYISSRAGTATIAGATVTFTQKKRRRQEMTDFDGDGRSDPAVFRPSTGYWYVLKSTTGSTTGLQFGMNGDKPAPGDYDGDGKTDYAVYRPSTGIWYIKYSSNSTTGAVQWGGTASDIPVPADYDGDAKTDVAVYRRSVGYWYIVNSSTGSATNLNWGGLSDDWPVVGDYDGDGRADPTIFRRSSGGWYIINLRTKDTIYGEWGIDTTDVPAMGDFDGDGRTDLAFFHAAIGGWWVYYSSSLSGAFLQWGNSATNIPTPADVSGDGKTDLAVFAPGFYTKATGSGAQVYYNFGAAGDIPVTK
jgi:hypothetical protein